MTTVRIRTIRDILPPACLKECLRQRPDCNDAATGMLHWDADSAVGDDVTRIVVMAKNLTENMADVKHEPIWEAVAHQCLVFAYA